MCAVRLGIIIMVMLALTAAYYLTTTMFKPSQPQVVVVRPSGAQSTAQNTTQPITPVGVGGSTIVCVKAFYLKVGSISICADVVYSMAKTDDGVLVDFQGGIISGSFAFTSAPACVVSTTPQGVQIPCRAQVLIPVK
jgi:monoamine oxidase